VSRVMLSGDVVYVSGSGDPGGVWSSFVVALRASDGTVLWRHEWSGQILFSEPVVADGLIYVSEQFLLNSQPPGDIIALQATDGSLVRRYVAAAPPPYTSYSMPTVSNGVLYATMASGPRQGQYFFFFALASGKEAWRSGAVGKNYGT